MKAETFDKEKVFPNIARLKKGGENFEVVVDADAAISYKEKGGEVRDVLKSEDIFSDAKDGQLASEELMDTVFETHDPLEVAAIILETGEIQLTAEYRQSVRDRKKARILSIIQRNGVDPQTHLPHPLTRIENAYDQAKPKIDEFKTAESQVQDVVKDLRPILPIAFEVKEIEVIIPATYASKSFGMIKNLGTILKQNWQGDGSLYLVLEVPGGMEQDFYDELNKLTQGNNKCKVLNVR